MEVILEYLGRLSVVKRVFIIARQEIRMSRRRCNNGSREWSDAATSQGS